MHIPVGSLLLASTTRLGSVSTDRLACRGRGKCGLCERCDLDDLKTPLPHLADVLIGTEIERGVMRLSGGGG